MKFECILPESEVLKIEDKSNQDGSITWVSVTFMQGDDVNTVTCVKEVAKSLKVGSKYPLVLKASEQARAYNNGSGAYIETKFRIIGVAQK